MLYYYNSSLNIRSNSSAGRFEVGKLYKDVNREYVLCFKKEYSKRHGGCWELYFLCRNGMIKIITFAPSSIMTVYKNSLLNNEYD